MEEKTVKVVPQPPVLAIILAPLVFFLLLALYSRFLGPLPISVTSTVTSKTDLFTTSGEGKVTAVPDIAQINLGITANSTTVKEAQNQANAVMNKIIKDLRGQGIEEKDIQTTSYYVNPNYDYNSGSPRITGYEVRINLETKVRDFEKINSVIDTATADGANLVGGLSFSVNDEKLKELQKEARVKAVAAAKEKAEELSRASGIRLGKIINVQEGFSSPYQPRYFGEMAMIGAAKESTQVQPGEQEIQVNITLTYETL